MSEVANSFKVIGLLKRVFPTERKSDKFQCREFVIEIAAKYPEFIKFQLTQDRCDLIDAYTEGADKIEVSFNVTGREWQGKFFTMLNAWEIKRTDYADVPKIEAKIEYQKKLEAQEAFDQTPTQAVPFPVVVLTQAAYDNQPSPIEPLKAADTDDLPF